MNNPEEAVRVQLIETMKELGYPSALISTEKSLSKLPHLCGATNLPSRRLDIVCFAKNLHSSYPLYPLLLIECKAVPLTQNTIEQVTGYNHFVGSYFVAIANQKEVRTGWKDHLGEYRFKEGLFPYESLINSVRGGIR